jgi:hypothetical protein
MKNADEMLLKFTFEWAVFFCILEKVGSFG